MQSGSVKSQAEFRSELGLFLARFCASAWIGAASLFVIVGVIEVTRGGFDSSTKDQLVALRFPAFYSCGVVMLGTSAFGAWLTGKNADFPAKRRFLSLILLAIVLGLMAIDYVFIYRPLFQMVTPPGQAKPAGFAAYHDASKKINLVGLIFCLVVAGLVNWPVRRPSIGTSGTDPRNQNEE